MDIEIGTNVSKRRRAIVGRYINVSVTLTGIEAADVGRVIDLWLRNMEVRAKVVGSGHQSLTIKSTNPQQATFKVELIRPGLCTFAVNAYWQNHWLAAVSMSQGVSAK